MTKSNDLVDKVALLAIGLVIGVFCTIARTQTMLAIELRIALVAASVGGLFVGLFSLRPSPSKDYETNDTKDHATDDKMVVLIPSHSNEGTNYHQAYAKPLHSVHIFVSLLRRIISHCKEVVNQQRQEPIFFTEYYKM